MPTGRPPRGSTIPPERISALIRTEMRTSTTTYNTTFRLTRDEIEVLRAAAAICGTTVSDFVRAASLTEAVNTIERRNPRRRVK